MGIVSLAQCIYETSTVINKEVSSQLKVWIEDAGKLINYDPSSKPFLKCNTINRPNQI